VPANSHLTLAMPPLLMPMVEYLVKWNELLQFFWKNPVKPVDGTVTLSDRPGFGMEYDPSRIESDEELRWVEGSNMAGSIQERQ
jgi:L-alanine-DL-glutamate epimerase-like enolase superfamily enzyme